MTGMGGLRLWAAAAAMMGAMASPSVAQVWFCEYQITPFQMGWIPVDTYIQKKKDGTFEVRDGMIQGNGREFLVPEIVEDSEKRITLRWYVDTTSSTGNIIRMSYRATIFRGDNTIRLTGKDGVYSNDPEGRGTCQVK